MKRFIYKWKQFRERLEPRVANYVLLAFLTMLAANYFGHYVPEPMVDRLKDVDVNSILLALATTMLTISTFALSTTVTANMNAVGSTTPRVLRLLLRDERTQNMLVVFLGSFAFSVTTLLINPIAMQATGGRVILLLVTAYLLVRILYNFILWTMSIRNLGSMSHTLDKIETISLQTFAKYWKDPFSSCQAWYEKSGDTETFKPIYFGGGQYIQLVDENMLDVIARGRQIEVYVNYHEGDFVTEAEPIVWIKGEVDDRLAINLKEAFVLAKARDLQTDGRFGLIMLEETGSKALSAAINDTGTAKDCIHTAYRIFSAWPPILASKIRYQAVWKRPVRIEQCMRDFYLPLAHDGADNVGVHIEIMTSLAGLRNSQNEECAKATKNVAHLCYERAIAELQSQDEQERVREIFERFEAIPEKVEDFFDPELRKLSHDRRTGDQANMKYERPVLSDGRGAFMPAAPFAFAKGVHEYFAKIQIRFEIEL